MARDVLADILFLQRLLHPMEALKLDIHNTRLEIEKITEWMEKHDSERKENEHSYWWRLDAWESIHENQKKKLEAEQEKLAELLARVGGPFSDNA